ncbi:hypothetical protein ACNOYE_27250 [Nannocystaceae bacterium ST9]
MTVAERVWSWLGLWLLTASVLVASLGTANAGPPRGRGKLRREIAASSEVAGKELEGVRRLHAVDPDRSELRGLVWQPASVAWPIDRSGEPHERFAAAIALLEPREPGEPLPVASTRGPIDLDAQRAALVWIEALETVRVRQIAGQAKPRFWRITDGHAAIAEPGIARGPRSWELFQPPGLGALWLIESADEPPHDHVRVIVERARARAARFVDVEVERELLDWIHARTDAPARSTSDPTPPTILGRFDGVEDRLRLHELLAAELLALPGADEPLREGLEAWQMLAGILELDRERDLARPYFAIDRHEQRLPGTAKTRLRDPDSRDYRVAESGRDNRWTIDLRGAGRLSIAARSLGSPGSATAAEHPEQPSELEPAELRVWADGRLIDRIELSPRPARRSPDPDTVVPTFVRLATVDDRLAGELARLELSVPPGAHEYELELVGGPALVWARGARRIERVAMNARGWTPRRLLARANKRFEASASPAAAWAARLLARTDHRAFEVELAELDTLAVPCPALALTLLAQLALADRLDGKAVHKLGRRALPWLARLDRDPAIDPEVRGWLRTQWLEIAALHDDVALARELARDDEDQPIADLPVHGLRLLAGLIGTSDAVRRSTALALLELARRRAPIDADLRRQYLRLWTTQSRWSRRRPIARDATLLEPLGSWLMARESVPLATGVAQADEAEPSWLRLDPGVPVRVRADRLSGAQLGVERPRQRLFDLHVSTPEGAPEALRVRVDDRSWWSPMLQPVQRHRLAVAPGVHELQLDAPPGTIAWVELPPAESTDAIVLDRLGRREQLWPLDRVTWLIPGPAMPGFVRLDLRWLDGVPARPVEIRARQDGSALVQTLWFDPRGPSGSPIIDGAALPIDGSPAISERSEYVFTIDEASTKIWFEVEVPGEPDAVVPIAASLSLRRAPRVGDDPTIDPELGVIDPAPTRSREFFDLPVDEEALLSELAGLSRVLLLDPHDLPARARRTAALLAIGETGHARADLLWLTSEAERSDATRAHRREAERLRESVQAYFEALFEPGEIIVEDPERAGEPAMIEPALAAVIADDEARLQPGLALWAEGRSRNPDEALALLEGEAGAALRGDSLLAQLTRAQWLVVAGRFGEAGRLLTRVYGRMPGSPGHARDPIAVGVAAVVPLLRRLDDPSEADLAGLPGLAYGLARELEPVHGHMLVRRLAFVAALRSEWSTFDHSENNVGFERLDLPTAEQQPSAATRVRETLLVAPWPAEQAELLQPGHQATIAWDAEPGPINLALWCRAARPDLAPLVASDLDDPSLGHASVKVRLRAEGQAAIDERTLTIADAEQTRVELNIARRARHRLEVGLSDDPLWQCSLRTSLGSIEAAERDEDRAIDTRRRALWWTASPERGVELVALGPAAIQIESRAVLVAPPEPDDPDADPPRSLFVEVEALRPDPEFAPLADDPAGRFPLAGTVERAVITEQRRRFFVSESHDVTVLLTEPGPHRIRITSEQGRALVRVRMRRDRPDLPPPVRVSLRELEPYEEPPRRDDLRLPVPMPEPVEIEALDRLAVLRNRIGSFEASLLTGVDDLTDVDDLRPRLGLAARVGWRRALIDDRLWLMIAADLRVRDQSPVAAGGVLRISGVIPRTGLRTGLQVGALAQPYHGRSEGSVRVEGFIDRPTPIGRWFQLRPGLDVAYRWQSLTPGELASSGLEPNPLVYQRYVHDHPFVLRPELGLRVFPLQDLASFVETGLVPNSNFVGIDHFDVEVGVDGIAREPRPWLPIYRFGYQSSLRFADADRDAFYVRHRLEASLGAGLWLRDVVLMAFGVRDRLYLTSGNAFPLRNVIELWIRVDGVFGRRLRDQGPRERWFREPLAPRAWADEPNQAESTSLDRQVSRHEPDL